MRQKLIHHERSNHRSCLFCLWLFLLGILATMELNNFHLPCWQNSASWTFITLSWKFSLYSSVLTFYKLAPAFLLLLLLLFYFIWVFLHVREIILSIHWYNTKQCSAVRPNLDIEHKPPVFMHQPKNLLQLAGLSPNIQFSKIQTMTNKIGIVAFWHFFGELCRLLHH